MASTLKLTFDTTISPVEPGDSLNIFINTGSGIVGLSEVWALYRIRRGQASITDTFAEQDNAQAAILNFVQAWNIDYRHYGGKDIAAIILDFEIDTGEIELVLTDPVWTFEDPTGTLLDKNIVDFEITNSSIGTANFISAVIAKNDLDPCGKVDIDLIIEGDTGVYDISTSEGSYLGVTSPYTITFIRRAVHQFVFVNGLNHPIGTFERDLPRKINESDITIDLVYAAAGGASVSVNVSYINADISPYQYSFDGINYQSSNSFPSVAPGSYTIHVKDAFDCVTTKDFLVDGTSALTELVFNISELNPIRFIKKRLVAEKKNLANSLSCEEIKVMPYKGVHCYPYESSIPIQFQTNAPYIRVYAKDKDGAETDIPHFQSVKNTGLTGYTTASLFAVNGKATLYWGYVDELDPLTDVVIGNNNFGAFIPTWADDAGKVLNLSGIGDIPVSKIYYDPVRQSNVVELSSSYAGPEIIVNVKGTYNEQPYDVYEFVVSMSSLPSKFNLNIDYGVDAGNLQTGWTSEDVKQIEDSDEYLRLDYWDEDNRGNFIYQTGIQHHVYIKGVVDYVGEQSTEGYNGDNEFYKTNDEVYFSFNLVIEFLPSAFAHKLRLMCAHNFFYVNGLKCKLAEAPTVEGELATNLKTFTALVKTSGNQFLPMDLQNVLSESDNLSGALEAIQGKANILWTKING